MPGTRLSLQNVSLVFRVYGIGSRSLKKKIISFGTGGRLARDAANHFVVHALNNLSLDLKEGDRLGIMGRNGSGKSTLLRTMAGIFQPHTGQVTVSGRIAAIIDSGIGLETHATGLENIRSRAVLMGVPRSGWASFFERVTELSELGDYLSLPVHTYSSGMLMRLNFAMSVSIDPDILILDEWLSVADQTFRNKAEHHMSQLVDKSRVLVLASHNLDLVERLCNRGLYLDGGYARFAGSIQETIAAYKAGA